MSVSSKSGFAGKIIFACALMLSLAANPGLFADSNSNSESDDDLLIPDLNKLRPMNGLNPKDYSEFWNRRDWHLVTTRYRSDNGEQRFVFANDLAYDAMREGSMVFPDGSAFGKVAFLATEDPQFPNSFEPSNYTRLQIMVKDSKRFKELDGWSYYIHMDSGELIPSEDKDNAAACHACHTLVNDKDYIFTAPSFMGKLSKKYSQFGTRYKDNFKTRSVKDLSRAEQKIVSLLPQRKSKVEVLQMRLFTGSLFENIGPMASLVKSDKKTYMVFDPNEKRFIIAQPLKSTASCKSRVLYFMDGRKSKKTKDNRVRATRYLRKGLLCDGKKAKVKKTPFPASLQAVLKRQNSRF